MSLEAAILSLVAELKRANDLSERNETVVNGGPDKAADPKPAKAEKPVKAEKAATTAAAEANPNPYAAFGFGAEHIKAIAKLATELKLEPQGAAQKYTSDAVLAAVPKLGRDPVVAVLQETAGVGKVSTAEPSKFGAIYAGIAKAVADKASAAEDVG